MSDSEWLKYRDGERQRATAALADAADKSNTCRDIEDRLHKQGRDHRTDLGWLRAVRELQRHVEQAAAHGFDGQAISNEAARRRR